MQTIERKQGYLLVEWSEAFPGAEQGLAFMREAAELCRRETIGKILVDLSRTEGEMNLLDGFKVAAAGADIFRGVAKIAFVRSHSRLAGFIETVGLNRGAHIRMFDRIEEAEKWLGVNQDLSGTERQ